jgi:HlyD family secretion protein
MKKFLTILIVLAAVGGTAAFFYVNRGEKEPTVSTLKTSRGDIIDGVGATGTLQAVTTVTVGTQVSGIVQELYADFNDIVKKGQVVARLDPSILQTQVATAKANLVNANANLERQRVTLEDARQKLSRAEELHARQLTTKVDLENAQLAVKTAEAQMKSTQSSIVQAEAAVNKAEVDLDHTVIYAPITGIVIKRSVDKGQTVAASMSAPELFIIAADLTQMQVNASIDETDVGRMRPGQHVTFRVDAYPTETFHGSVKQVRLNPTTVQNVVTYSTVIDVPNPELKLKPGMTANVTIEVARRENVLRIPNAALRFRPTKDVFEALNQPMPPELERGFGRGQPGGRQNAGAGAPSGGPAAPAAQPGAGAPQVPAAAQGAPQAGAGTTGRPQGQSASTENGPRRQNQDGQGGRAAGQGGEGGGRGFGNMTPEERQRRQAEREQRMANMTPEERAQFQQRMRDRQAQGGSPGGVGGRGGAGNFQRNNQGQGGGGDRSRNSAPAQNQAPQSKLAATTSATNIDSLFAPIEIPETRGRAWLYVNKQLKMVNLRLGITDGTFTEVINEDELQPDADVVTGVVTAEMASRPASQQNNPNTNNNPLMPQRGGRGPGGGGGGGRGGGR